jgi:hypothetical protein
MDGWRQSVESCAEGSITADMMCAMHLPNMAVRFDTRHDHNLDLPTTVCPDTSTAKLTGHPFPFSSPVQVQVQHVHAPNLPRLIQVATAMVVDDLSIRLRLKLLPFLLDHSDEIARSVTVLPCQLPCFRTCEQAALTSHPFQTPASTTHTLFPPCTTELAISMVQLVVIPAS